MSRYYIHPHQIVTVYRYTKEGLRPPGIAEKTEMPLSAVKSVLRVLPIYLSGKAKDQLRRSKNYRQALKLLKQETLQPKPLKAPQKLQAGSHVATLREAYTNLEKAMQGYAQGELAQKQAALIKENEELKRQVVELSDRLYKLEVQQTRSWIDELEEDDR